MGGIATQLTAEEMAFLRALFANDSAGEYGANGSRRLLLDPAGSDAELLASLIGADRLELTAEHDALCFHFQLSLHRAHEGAPAELTVGYPRIVERQGRDRAARVQPDPDAVSIESIDENQGGVALRDISASGVSVTDTGSHRRRRNQRVRLQLRLEGEQRAQLRGRIARVQRDGAGGGGRTLGIEFEDDDPQTRATLDRLVFRNHPRLRRHRQ